MAIWSAEVESYPTEDNPEGGDIERIYSPPFMSIAEIPEVRAAMDAGDFRPYYRAILEHAFESDPRFKQGKVFMITMS